MTSDTPWRCTLSCQVSDYGLAPTDGNHGAMILLPSALLRCVALLVLTFAPTQTHTQLLLTSSTCSSVLSCHLPFFRLFYASRGYGGVP